MDRLARNLDDLRHLVQKLTHKGVRIEFVKECLTFTCEDSPMANLMLSVMGAFAEFERYLIHERQREGITLARLCGAYRGRKKSLSPEQQIEVRQRANNGGQKAQLAREFGISRETLYQSLKPPDLYLIFIHSSVIRRQGSTFASRFFKRGTACQLWSILW